MSFCLILSSKKNISAAVLPSEVTAPVDSSSALALLSFHFSNSWPCLDFSRYFLQSCVKSVFFNPRVASLVVRIAGGLLKASFNISGISAITHAPDGWMDTVGCCSTTSSSSVSKGQ